MPRRLHALLLATFAFLAAGGVWSPEARAAWPTAVEAECLALNIYWEARAEPREDQLAVAWVTLNRVASPKFPDSVCEVVYQGGEAPRFGCQFQWWCDGKPDTPANAEAWSSARALARKAIAEELRDPTGGALYFHNDTVSPSWATTHTLTATIGRHRYYK